MAVTSEDPDYSAAVVIDRETGEEMAAYRAHVLPEIFADDLVDLAKMYNNAEIVVERLGEGGTVITTIINANKFGNVYRHMDWWRRMADKKGANLARDFLARCPDLIWDRIYIKECMTFVYKDAKPQATEGSHDDTVLARALAYCVRSLRNGELNWENIRRRERYGQVPTEFAAEDGGDESI